MNAHRVYMKSIKRSKSYFKQERREIKKVIKNAINKGEMKTLKYIDYPENVEWLKKKGFNLTEVNSIIDAPQYEISWKDC